MDRYAIAVAGFLLLDVLLTVARVVEVIGGHVPTPVLNAAFSLCITGTVALLAAGRMWHIE